MNKMVHSAGIGQSVSFACAGLAGRRPKSRRGWGFWKRVARGTHEKDCERDNVAGLGLALSCIGARGWRIPGAMRWQEFRGAAASPMTVFFWTASMVLPSLCARNWGCRRRLRPRRVWFLRRGRRDTPRPAMARVAPPRSEGFFGDILGSGKATAPAQRMASYSFDSHGIFSVTLSNGEVWRQVEGDSNFAHWRGPASSYVVIVRSGAFGSSNLQVQGQSTTFKVERAR